ncbi:MAG TPA: hypothetical protein VE961_11945, partial [Pyrinomonadaceae bacterium]|nr:hypothetical protein [Pyrinomonadaceae bacterium]
MVFKSFLGIVCSLALIASAFSQGAQTKLATQSAPALRIVSAPFHLDRDERKVTLSVELENTGDKTITAFGWAYRTQGPMRGYNVSGSSDMPEVSIVLAPNEKKKVVLLENVELRESVLEMPFKEIAITSVVFEDGSVWKRKEENQFSFMAQPNKSLDRSRGNPDASGIKRDPAKLL